MEVDTEVADVVPEVETKNELEAVLAVLRELGETVLGETVLDETVLDEPVLDATVLDELMTGGAMGAMGADVLIM